VPKPEPLSDQDQRILALLDADVTDSALASAAARLRARHSAAGLYLATLASAAADTALMFLGANNDNLTLVLSALLLFCFAPVPAAVVARYGPHSAPAAPDRPLDRPDR